MIFPQNRVEGEIDFFPSTVREHPHSLIYEPNDGRDCHTSAPYRRMTSGHKMSVQDLPASNSNSSFLKLPSGYML